MPLTQSKFQGLFRGLGPFSVIYFLSGFAFAACLVLRTDSIFFAVSCSFPAFRLFKLRYKIHQVYILILIATCASLGFCTSIAFSVILSFVDSNYLLQSLPWDRRDMPKVFV